MFTVEYGTASNWLHNNRIQNDYNDTLCQLMVHPGSSHTENPQPAQLDCAAGQTYAIFGGENMGSAMAGSSLHSIGRDMEPGTKRITPLASIENRDCEYLKLVAGFKRTLVLPDIFFSFDAPSCYCLQCSSNKEWNTLEGKCWSLVVQYTTNMGDMSI